LKGLKCGGLLGVVGLAVSVESVESGRALSGRLHQPATSPRVVLPEQNLLVIDELCARRLPQLGPEVLVLQQLQEVQTRRVLQVPTHIFTAVLEQKLYYIIILLNYRVFSFNLKRTSKCQFNYVLFNLQVN